MHPQSAAEHIRLTEVYGAHNYHPLPIVINGGEGVWVDCLTESGKIVRKLDCLSAYSALNHGHRHPRIVAAAHRQLDILTLTSRAFYNDQLGPWLEEMYLTFDYTKVLPMNTGAEAVETAIKLARKWGYKIKGVPEGLAEIIVCAGNFHGRTTTIVGFSDEPQYQDGFGPFTPGFKIIPYGDLEALQAAITPNTVGFLVEPIQGESGIKVPPENFLDQAREICEDNEVLLIGDEIQTGMGRTGKVLASWWEAVSPDILILGKALGGGIMPISAVLADDEIMGVIHPGDHGSTFGGNPLACAISLEALAVLKEEKLADNSLAMGNYFMEQLSALDSPHVEIVRGRGLFIGVVIKESSGKARPFCEKLAALDILCKETHDQVIRFAPPLIITKDEIDWAMERIRQVLC